MRILIISTFFPPLNSIASLRPYSWAKEWSKEGHDVTVLTTEKQQQSEVTLKLFCSGYRVLEVPLPRVVNQAKSSYYAAASKKKETKGLSVWLERIRQRYGIFNACRMPDVTDLWIRPAFKELCTQEPFDILVSSSGPYSVHILGYLAKKKGHAKKWVADYRDTWSDNYFYRGIFPLNLLEKALERRILHEADVVTTVSEPLAKVFSKKWKVRSAVTVPNGFDPQDLANRDPLPSFAEDGKYRIVHTGSIYLGRRDPSPLFQAIKELYPVYENILNSLEVIFVGVNQGNLHSLIDRYQVHKWVKYCGFVSREKALAMQRDANALLFLPWNDPKVDGIITGKIYEYFFSKTPIIAVGASHMELSQKMILEAHSGKIFHTVTEIKSYLLESLNHSKKRPSVIDDDFLKKYDRAFIAQNFLELLKG